MLCDACTECGDFCDYSDCKLCEVKRQRALLLQSRCGRRTFTLCEIRRHTKATDCWIVARDKVYNITDILGIHPGGFKSLLRKSGGQDCHQDWEFHTKEGRELWKKFLIGTVVPCKSKTSGRRWCFW
jgi:predicted heme/steroid binding protein